MPIMPAGTYIAKIVGTKIGTTSKGDPQVEVRFENDDGEHISYFGYFSSKALPFTLKTLKTCGWDAAEHGMDVTSLHGSTALVGKQVEVVVEDNEYNGKVNQKVAWVNSLGLTLDEVKAIGEKLKGAISREVSADGGEPDLSSIPF